MIKTIVTKDSVERIDMTEAEEAAFVAESEVQRLLGLQSELDHLELATAKGFLWLVKLLISNGTIQLSDIPDKLIAYKTRIEEIEAELAQ